MFKVFVVFGDNEKGDDIHSIDGESHEKHGTELLDMIWEIIVL